MSYLLALALTLLLECPAVAIAYRAVVPVRRSLATALAVNLATHGLLWSVWPALPGAYGLRLAAAEAAVVVVEAACYRALLGATIARALVASSIANALSTAAGLVLQP